MPDARNTVNDVEFVTTMVEGNVTYDAKIGSKQQLFASKWVVESPSSLELVVTVSISYLNAHAGREFRFVGTFCTSHSRRLYQLCRSSTS
jgi:hypothetical protein